MSSAASSAFQKFMNSPTGPKTVHFWAPVMKWGLVLAGAGEMARPVEKVSAIQQLSLFATGAIWTRWATVITPKNYLLASVNFFLGSVAAAQVVRISYWRKSLGDSPMNIVRYLLDMPQVPDTPAVPAVAPAAAAKDASAVEIVKTK